MKALFSILSLLLISVGNAQVFRVVECNTVEVLDSVENKEQSLQFFEGKNELYVELDLEDYILTLIGETVEFFQLTDFSNNQDNSFQWNTLSPSTETVLIKFIYNENDYTSQLWIEGEKFRRFYSLLFMD